ncbi:MAG: hypothetical protein Q9M75_08160, partial [Ghiorsea sp.]|nr:hypothetical protein [Ghiorsea sp.]
MGSDVFNLALDALMVMAITGLWVMWFQQSAQRKKVEKMLRDASKDLKSATELLDQVMRNLDMQQQSEQEQVRVKHPAEALQQRQPKKDKLEVAQPAAAKAPVKPKEVAARQGLKSKDSGVDTAKIMRLHREGLNEQTIADQLKVPVAQVRLILLLQS